MRIKIVDIWSARGIIYFIVKIVIQDELTRDVSHATGFGEVKWHIYGGPERKSKTVRMPGEEWGGLCGPHKMPRPNEMKKGAGRPTKKYPRRFDSLSCLLHASTNILRCVCKARESVGVPTKNTVPKKRRPIVVVLQLIFALFNTAFYSLILSNQMLSFHATGNRK